MNKCKVCNHELEHGDCGNLHTYCTWCGYGNGIDGEFIPEWNDDLEWDRLEHEYKWCKD